LHRYLARRKANVSVDDIKRYERFFLNWLCDIKDVDKDGILGRCPASKLSSLQVHSDMVYVDEFGLNLVLYDFNDLKVDKETPIRWYPRIQAMIEAFRLWDDSISKVYTLHLGSGERIFYDPAVEYNVATYLGYPSFRRPGLWCYDCKEECFVRERKTKGDDEDV
jgi:hypothetical protein